MKILKIFTQYIKYLLSISKRFFVVPEMPKNKDGKILVHVGCGDLDDPCYINVDARPMKHIHHVTRDINGMDFLASDSVDLVYMCHVLEHFDRKKVKEVILETYRILKKGGVFRISVPDFDSLVDIYLENNREMNHIITPLFGGQDYPFNYHYNLFNARSLKGLLEKCGFSSVNLWDPLSAEHHGFNDWSARKFKVGEKEYAISLNLEAVK